MTKSELKQFLEKTVIDLKAVRSTDYDVNAENESIIDFIQETLLPLF